MPSSRRPAQQDVAAIENEACMFGQPGALSWIQDAGGVLGKSRALRLRVQAVLRGADLTLWPLEIRTGNKTRAVREIER